MGELHREESNEVQVTVIEALKKNDQVASLIFVVDDPESKKIMAAWMYYRPAFKDRPLKPKENPEEAGFSENV
jgi:hypothetical protein